MPLNTARPSAARRLALNLVLLAILGLALLSADGLTRYRRRQLRLAHRATALPGVVSPLRGFTAQNPAAYASGKLAPVAVFTGRADGLPRRAYLYTGAIRGPVNPLVTIAIAHSLYAAAWTALKTQPTGTAMEPVPIKPSGEAYIIQGRHLSQGGFVWTITVARGALFRTLVYFGPGAETARDVFNEQFLQATAFAGPA